MEDEDLTKGLSNIEINENELLYEGDMAVDSGSSGPGNAARI